MNMNLNLSNNEIQILKDLMKKSAEKGDLANAGIVLEDSKVIASAGSWVVSNCDATAHSERMLVETVCKQKNANYTPNLTLITVTEPCLMCLSACAWAGYNELAYIIPASKYIKKIPWMAEITKINKMEIASNFSKPLKLSHLSNYEDEFSKNFEKLMKELLK